MLSVKKKRIFLAIALIMLITSIRWNGPYRGKVVELETGKPIEGAVVAATWSYTCLNVDRICSAKETLTDKDGSFKLPLAWCITAPFATLSAVQPSEVVVFKPGYLGYPPIIAHYGINERMPEFTGQEFRRSKQFYVIKLGKPKTLQERQLTQSHAQSLLTNQTISKLPLLIKLVNEERGNLGLSEVYKKGGYK